MSEINKDEIVFLVKASPYFWRQKAEELKFAAEVLWPGIEKRQKEIIKSIDENVEIQFNEIDPDTFSIFLSLIGFSSECLFKGVAIRDNPSYVANGKLNKALTSHNLIKLSKIAKIILSRHEEIFCKQAYTAMVVDSRYPIPKEAGDSENLLEIGGHCKEVFTQLYNRLYPTLSKINKRAEIKLSSDK